MNIEKDSFKIIALTSTDVIKYKEELICFLEIDFNETYKSEVKTSYIENKINGLVEYIDHGMACTFGAVIKGKLVGFLWGYIIDSPVEKVFHIAYLAVDQDYRKQGLGVALIRSAENAAKSQKVRTVELIVAKKNQNAIRFYEKSGYDVDRMIYRKEI